MKDRNQLLLDFASDWTLDGDLLRCRACKRAQIASRQDEDFVHRSDCKKKRTGGRPWTFLQSILLTLPSGQSVMDLLAAANAQRDDLLRAAKEAEEVLALMERPRIEDPSYGAEVRALGYRIGFGALMSSASASWRKMLEGSGGPVGGEHCAGPCHATVLMTLKVVRDAIARAQSGQPAQPPTKDVALQGGECAFFDELPKGPSIGRFSASDRAELDELKRKAFKAGES